MSTSSSSPCTSNWTLATAARRAARTASVPSAHRSSRRWVLGRPRVGHGQPPDRARHSTPARASWPERDSHDDAMPVPAGASIPLPQRRHARHRRRRARDRRAAGHAQFAAQPAQIGTGSVPHSAGAASDAPRRASCRSAIHSSRSPAKVCSRSRTAASRMSARIRGRSHCPMSGRTFLQMYSRVSFRSERRCIGAPQRAHETIWRSSIPPGPVSDGRACASGSSSRGSLRTRSSRRPYRL